MVRRIVERHTLLDSDGFAWDAEVTIPWVDHPDDVAPMGVTEPPVDMRPQVTLHTPNDPEHYTYGETGPCFDLSGLAVLVMLARRHEAATP